MMTNQDKFELAKGLLLDFKKYVVWIHKLAQGTEYDMMPCHIQICDTLQKYAEGRNEKRNLMINCPPGCLAGDSVISINRHKNGSTITIKDLYEKFNGLSGKWVSGPVYIRRAINGKVRLSKIEAVVYKGEQFTWEIVLEDGKRLRATGGHKIMVKDGFKKVEELKPGDLVAVDNKQIRGTGGRKTRLRDRDFVVGKLHPFGRWHKDCYRISLHRAVYEANMNGLDLEDFRKRTYTNTDGMYFVPRDMHIHHIDGNHNNNTPDNLEILDCRTHLLKHGLESNFGQGRVDYVAIKEILPGKFEPVYDIQCEEIEGCEPNYNANGILVHNTGKSLLIQYFITWCFARIKNSMFCYVAFGERLIKKLSRDSRNLMMMPEWEELFGKEMDPSDKSVLNYHLISGGVRSGLTAGTVSSAMLGLDAGVPGIDGFSGMLIMDDPNSPEVVSSVHEQIELPEVYQRKLATRRRTPTVPTFCVMQRHSVNDFAGWVAKNEPDEWEWVVIPAIDAEGNSFYPKRYPIEELRRLEKQNPFMFAAMYQQCPVENYGAYFHEEWIRTYRATPEKFSKVFITTDFGFTTSGDKSLFCCWGLANDNNMYLLRSRVGKWESPDAKRYCIEFFNHCAAAFRQCRRVYVENTLSGLGFIQDMKREAPQMAIVPLKRGAKKNKMNRAESAMTWMEAGRVYFREADPNYVGARAELLAYNPADKNPKDEWIDNIGDACEISFNMKTSSIFI